MAEAKKNKCPSCGNADHIQLLRHQGETYYQCMAPKHRPDERERGGAPTGYCKYWSTKWRPAPSIS